MAESWEVIMEYHQSSLNTDTYDPGERSLPLRLKNAERSIGFSQNVIRELLQRVRVLENTVGGLQARLMNDGEEDPDQPK